MEELQALGEELVALAPDRVKRIDIPTTCAPPFAKRSA
jgi:ribosomal 50S subunit-associated protein YjgA (DUF615 family)